MKDEVRKLLFDVVDSGDSILGWMHGRTFADYEMDRQFRRAVEREFEIIGEALNRLRRDAHLPGLIAKARSLLEKSQPERSPF